MHRFVVKKHAGTHQSDQGSRNTWPIRQWARLLIGTVLILITACIPAIAQTGTAPDVSDTSTPILFDIAPQPLNTALRDFALSTGLQLSFHDDLAKDIQSPGIQGRYTPEQALQQLLAETELDYRFTRDNTITIEKSSPANTSGSIRLKTVTVTAQKREEDIRKVPFGVSAIRQEELEQSRIINNEILVRGVPNLNIMSDGFRAGNRLNMRGVGNPAGLGFAADDVSVGYFVDGIPLPLTAMDADLLDIKQVEILRGPQNVLFGRNAQAGAISVTTADPAENPEFSFGGEFGNLLQRKVTAIASGPLTDGIGGRLAVQYRGREGDIPNILGGEDLRDTDAVNVLGKLTTDFGANTDASLFVRYEYNVQDPVFVLLLEDPKFPRVRQDDDPDQITENLTTGLTVNHRMGDLTVTSLTGFHYTDFSFFDDHVDGLLFGTLFGVPAATFDDSSTDFTKNEVDERRINQEFRLTGETQGIDWLLGANFFYSDYDAVFKNTLPTFGLVGDHISDINTQSYDVFGSATVPITNRLRVSAAVRYTYEIEEFDGGFVASSPTAPVAANLQKESKTFDFVSGRLSVSFDLSDDTTTYVSVARGGKAGGFPNLDTDLAFTPGIDIDQFGTAITMSYEMGIRGAVWDNRIRFSIDGFFTDTSDENINVINQTTFVNSIQSIDTETYGAEFEIAAQPFDTLTLQGSLGLLKTKITDAPGTSGARIGGDIPHNPELSFSLGADYRYPMDQFDWPGVLIVGAQYQYVGSRDLDVANTVSLNSYNILNLRMGFVTEDYEIIAFAQNVLDEIYPVGGFRFGTNPATGGPVSGVVVSQPRLYGVGAKIRF